MVTGHWEGFIHAIVILLTAYVVATVAVFKEADNSNILGDTKAEAASLFGGVATAEPAR